MKSTLPILLFSLIAISCGGSSGGGNDSPENCTKSSTCRNVKFIRTRLLDKNEAKILLTNNEDTFEEIYAGMSFIEVTNCFVKEGDPTSGTQVLRYEVKSWDIDNRKAVMKVTREIQAESNSCVSSYFDYDEYVVHKTLSGLKTYLKRLDQFSKFSFGTLNSNPAIKMSKTEIYSEYTTQLDSIVDMSNSILTAISVESEANVGAVLYASNENFFEILEDVNPNEIEINGLQVIYSND